MIAAICGIVRFDNRKLSKDFASSMLEKMPIPPNKLTQCITLENASFALACSDSYSNDFEQEITLKCSKGLFVASGLVYNDDTSDESPYSVLRKVWEGSSKTDLEQINGDCMYVGYDIQKNSIQLYESWGFSCLYYYHCESFLAFASHPYAFKCLPEIKMQPNIELMNCILHSMPLTEGESFWTGVTKMIPGTMVEIGAGGILNMRTITSNNINRPTGTSNTNNNYEMNQENFLKVFRNAINQRIDVSYSSSSTLSAGLDSGAITALLSEKYQDANKALTTWTSASAYLDESFAPIGCLKDETELACLVAKSMPNIRHEVVDSMDTSVINAIRLIVYITGCPQYSPANFYWIEDILSRVHASSSERLFIGQCGNGTISWTPTQPKLFPKKTFFPKTSMKNFLKLIRFRSSNKIKSALSGKISPASVTQRQLIEMHKSIFDLWYHLSLWSGVEVVDPTLDIELIKLLLSFPENAYYQDGVDRRLLREGMRGILPDKVRLNRKRGQQSSDIVARVKRQAKQVRKALALISTSELARENLDLNSMSDILEEIVGTDLKTLDYETAKSIDNECNLKLLRGISAGLFLAQFDTDIALGTPI